MKIKFIYKIIPIPIFYTNKLPQCVAGASYGPWIKIREYYEDDKPLLKHELTHSKQWYRLFILHGLLYRISKKWRFKSEVEAYAVQASCYSGEELLDKIELYSEFISSERYNLGVTTQHAYCCLINYINNYLNGDIGVIEDYS